MKQAEVYLYDRLAGILTESDEGYHFCYDTDYLASEDAEAISLTLPLTSERFIWNEAPLAGARSIGIGHRFADDRCAETRPYPSRPLVGRRPPLTR